MQTTSNTITETFIPSKDASLEHSISTLQAKLLDIGFHVEERSWLNEIEGIWSVHVTDRDCTRLFSNGKGASQLAARASALGEYFERLSTNYFWTHFYLGENISNQDYVHYPNEKWFPLTGDAWPAGLLNKELHKFYNPEGTVSASKLIDLNSGNAKRGICAIPYTRLRDDEVAYFPVNLIGNLYVSNGMSAGNTLKEARTQALAEIFERDIKYKIIREGICLPDVPEAVINRYPRIAAGIKGLRDAGYGIEWGPGRHGPGDNAFNYFVGPFDVVIEYTAEVQQIDDSYQTGQPSDWTWPPGRVDQWGISAPPSARLKDAQKAVLFVSS